ncbi:MAG: DUF5110 domain-containing protein, partial [Muribaculaceae bacterium]|nr:DUF5110 domain-containing protein [Muribaculaceae bacterium]
LWVERVYNGLREDFPAMRPFIMPRSGTSGMQRYSTFPWTGDILRSWGGLAAQIPALINMSMSGVSYLGSDVGGFTAESTNPELYLRWVEFATFSPMMRTHSANNPEPTQAAYRDILPSVRDFINLRYRFLPYTYTLSYLNSSEGLPIARPACAFDSDPRKLADCNDAYLWGKELYIAPVISSSTSRKITFPEGEWVDMNDLSRVYSGGESIIYSADIATLPYFMRRGSFIPMFTQTSGFGSTSEINYSDLTLLHYADTSKEGVSEGLLFEDDRTSASSLDNGDFTLLHFRGESDEHGNYAVSIEPEIGGSAHFMPETRTLRIRLLGYNGTDTPELSIIDRIPEIEEAFPEVPEIDPTEGEEISPAEERNLIREAQPAFELKSNREEVDSHPGHAYCIDDNGELYMKATAPADSKVKITFGNISTGIEAFTSDKGVTIEYVAGTLNYSLPAGSEGCRIEFYSSDGRKIGISEPLRADGKIHSLQTPEEKGFYIARLKGKSVKFVR